MPPNFPNKDLSIQIQEAQSSTNTNILGTSESKYSEPQIMKKILKKGREKHKLHTGKQELKIATDFLSKKERIKKLEDKVNIVSQTAAGKKKIVNSEFYSTKNIL